MEPLQKRVIFARRSAFLFALCGLFVATYLFIVYTSGAPIACGSVIHGCDVVRASRWSSVFGLPTPLFGMMFYMGMAGLLIVRTALPDFFRKRLYQLFIVGAVAGLIESIFLTSIQIFEIHFFCTWCLGSAVSAVCLFVSALFDRSYEFPATSAKTELNIQFFSLFGALVLGAVGIVLLTSQKGVVIESPPVISGYEISETERSALLEKIAPQDMSLKGVSNAPMTIVEFVDFECPSCRLFHVEMKKALEELGDGVKFGYRMFPLPMHSHARESAIAAICADEQRSLFPYVDTLMESDGLTREDFVRRATDLKLDVGDFISCLDDLKSKNALIRDLEDGGALGVRATPTIFVNDTMLQGLPSADQLVEIVRGLKEK